MYVFFGCPVIITTEYSQSAKGSYLQAAGHVSNIRCHIRDGRQDKIYDDILMTGKNQAQFLRLRPPFTPPPPKHHRFHHPCQSCNSENNPTVLLHWVYFLLRLIAQTNGCRDERGEDWRID